MYILYLAICTTKCNFVCLGNSLYTFSISIIFKTFALDWTFYFNPGDLVACTQPTNNSSILSFVVQQTDHAGISVLTLQFVTFVRCCFFRIFSIVHTYLGTTVRIGVCKCVLVVRTFFSLKNTRSEF